MKKKDTASAGAKEWGSAPTTRITPQEVQQKEFQVARFGAGYRMREVDEFLDQVTDALSALVAENERLLRGVDRGPAPVRPATDDADRAAVEDFLRREKGFLQDLGGLVQGHAEELRSMVRAVRRDAVAPAVALPAEEGEESPLALAAAAMTMPASMSQAADEPSPPFEQTADDADGDSGAIGSAEQATTTTDAASDEPGGDEREEPGGSTTIAGASADEPIRLDEPEAARSRRSDEEDDGSLRELFWGEE
jgi:DivIVA domain-containing protein